MDGILKTYRAEFPGHACDYDGDHLPSVVVTPTRPASSVATSSAGMNLRGWNAPPLVETQPATPPTTRPPSLGAQPQPQMEPLRDRWIIALVEGEDGNASRPDAARVDIYGRIIKTYPAMLSRGELPPIIHHRQLATDPPPRPLARCMDIMGMCSTSTTTLAFELMRDESQRLFAEWEAYDETTLTAAVQALLMYGIAAFFHAGAASGEGPPPLLIDSDYIARLQSASYGLTVRSRGLQLPAEQAHTRPRWDEWALVAAQRRTIMAVYYFEFQFNMRHRLAVLSCPELNRLPAPEPKSLWLASSRTEWERLYGRWLVRWEDGPYMIYELVSRHGHGDVQSSERLDRWMSEIDEFGTLVLVSTKFMSPSWYTSMEDLSVRYGLGSMG